MKKAILAITSTLHGQEYLDYLIPELPDLFSNCKEIIFIPFARPGGLSHDDYSELAQKVFDKLSLKIKGVHQFPDPEEAIRNAEGIFTGGGNTFLLVDKLYRNNVFDILKEKIMAGTPYLGTSAGTNIAGLTMQTTNDMPIIYPRGFKTLGVVPFNINVHYLDPDPGSTHKGESRETRIKEFHTINTQPVVGLREGSWIELKEDKILLKVNLPARIIKSEKLPYELEPVSNITDLN